MPITPDISRQMMTSLTATTDGDKEDGQKQDKHRKEAINTQSPSHTLQLRVVMHDAWKNGAFRIAQWVKAQVLKKREMSSVLRRQHQIVGRGKAAYTTPPDMSYQSVQAPHLKHDPLQDASGVGWLISYY